MKRETEGKAGYLNKLESKRRQAAIFENMSIQVLVGTPAQANTYDTKHTVIEYTRLVNSMKTRLYMELLSSLITGSKN